MPAAAAAARRKKGVRERGERESESGDSEERLLYLKRTKGPKGLNNFMFIIYPNPKARVAVI